MAKRIKSFSRKFLPFIITGLTILATVPTASFSLLHPQSVNAQQVSRGNGYVSIQLPSTGNQSDNWSCGPNSAARVLAFYGRNVDYNTVRSAVNQEFMLPPSVNVPAPKLTDPFRTRRVDIRTGTTPHVLRDVMKRWEGENVKLERKADFATLQRVLNEGKPVVALVRVGSIDTVVSGTWPEMHWISVTGFNEQKREIYYTDTDGGKYYYTYDEFLGKWDWRVGTGFASEALYKNGVQSRTIIWVDRTPPPDPSSSSSDAQQKIIGFYRDFLSREPRPDEIDFRMDAFRKGYPLERQRTDLAFGDEVRQKIIGFYKQYLGRDPESGAVEFRMNALLNGRTLEQQQVDIQSSPEARARQ